MIIFVRFGLCLLEKSSSKIENILKKDKKLLAEIGIDGH